MITANDNGILHTLGTVSENNGGVLHELNTVHANDGGVLHEIHSANKGATVSGITPLVAAEDHIVIVDSGSFTLSAPAGAKIIVGGAAKETSGGNVAEYTLESAVRNAQCTVQCAAVNSGGATTLTISGTTYGSGSTKQIIRSKWGPIGGEAGTITYGSYPEGYPGVATGAGGGAGVTLTPGIDANAPIGGKGGNNGGYGNFGGNGGGGYSGTTIGGDATASYYNGSDGASGRGGTSKYVGNGGGGGFSAGGGKNGGQGGAGIIVIEW